MQAESEVVRSREMLREEALIKSHRIQNTKNDVLPICVKRELHQSNDFQVVSAVVALSFSYGSNTRRIDHRNAYEDDLWDDGLLVCNSSIENTIC